MKQGPKFLDKVALYAFGPICMVVFIIIAHILAKRTQSRNVILRKLRSVSLVTKAVIFIFFSKSIVVQYHCLLWFDPSDLPDAL